MLSLTKIKILLFSSVRANVTVGETQQMEV